MSKFMYDMMEQPDAVRNLLSVAGEISEKARMLDFSRVIFTGMGASLHASDATIPYLRSHGVDAEIAEMSELISYGNATLLKKYGTIMLVSQSGESAELLRFMDDRRDLIGKMALITNNPDSSAAKKLPRERVFAVHAGLERSMGATKTFTNTIVTILMIGSSWSGSNLNLSLLPAKMEEALSVDTAELAETLSRAKTAIVVARGCGVGVGRMIRLMFAEVAKLSIVFYSGAAFRHGPVELLIDRPVVITLNPEGKTSPLMEELHQDISGKCELVTLSNFSSTSNSAKRVLVSMGLPEELSFIPMMNHLQKTAEELARIRDFDPGAGIYGSKVTTKE